MNNTFNNKKVPNVPNLRFPEFTDEWVESRLGEIAILTKGQGLSKEQLSATGQPCILYGELYTTYKNEIIENIYSKTEVSDKGLIKSRLNDVIIPSSGESAIDISTARCVNLDNIILGGDLNIIRLNNDSGAFLSYQLNGQKKIEIAKIAQGASVVHLYNQYLRKLKIHIPHRKEQTKIATLLSLIDQRIETQNKIIEDLKLLKNSLKKVVLSNISIEQVTMLGEICNIGTGKLDANAMVDNGKYPFFTCAENYFLINKYAFDCEALLISGNGANVGYINYYNGKFNAYQRTYVLTDFKENINYVKLFLQLYLKDRISAEKNIGNTPYIVMSTLSDMQISFPCKKKEQNIVLTFELFNKKIEQEKTVLILFKHQKKFLLKNLFI